MKKAVMLACAALAAACASAPAQPKIESMQGKKLNFGEAFSGSRVTRNVTIRNAGSDTLHIKSVEAQCGCTATMMAKRFIAPFDTGSLSITFNTKGYNGPATKHVYVKNDDPADPNFTIEFTTTVIVPLQMTPQYVQFANVQLDSTYRQTVTIKNNLSKTVKISDIRTDTALPTLKVTMHKKVLRPGDQVELESRFRAQKPGSFQGSIVLVTDIEQEPMQELRFFAHVPERSTPKPATH